jgi:hypothetical protein
MKKGVFFTATFLLYFSLFGFGQKSLSLTAGVGLPDAINVSVRLPLDYKNTFGLGLGGVHLEDESMFNASADYLHFFGPATDSRHNSQWYTSSGLTFLKDKSIKYIDNYLYVHLNGGRKWYFSKRTGLMLDAGILIELHHNRKQRVPETGWNLYIDMPLLSSINVDFFFILG